MVVLQKGNSLFRGHLQSYVLNEETANISSALLLAQCGRVTQICVFNTVKLGTSASSP